MDELFLATAELLVTNVRTETLGGREYLVTRAVILREQVLNGSDGPLFYPLSEINQDIGIWNGFPVTARHPFVQTATGQVVNVSARSPQVAHAFQIGTIYSDGMVNNTREVDVWVDIENANRIDPRIVPAIKAGQKINVSTGLTTQKVPYSSVYNGKNYTHVVKGIKPDHLAILMDEKGACSVDDGCGINIRNADKGEAMKCPKCGKEMKDGKCEGCGYTSKMTTNGQEAVYYLVTNCDCWKGKADTLNALDETQVVAIKNAEDTAKKAKVTESIITNLSSTLGFKDTDPAKLPAFVTNAIAEKDKKVKEAEEKAKTTTNTEQKVEITSEMVANAMKAMKEEDVLNLFPGIKNSVEQGKEAQKQQRYAVLEKLVANVSDEEQKKAFLIEHKDTPITILNQMVKLLTLNGANAPKPTPSPTNDNEKFLAEFFANNASKDQQSSGNGAGKSKDTRNDMVLNGLSIKGKVVDAPVAFDISAKD